MKDGFHVCYVCYKCIGFEHCLYTECIRMCSYDNSVSVNKGLDAFVTCDNPVQCGIDFCNIKCYKEENNE